MARTVRILLLLMPTSMWLLAAAVMPVFGLQLLMLGLAVLTFAGGLVLMFVARRRAWASMGRALGLEPMGKGPFPELAGTVRGLAIRVCREQVGSGRKRVERTVVRLPHGDELRLPGVVTDPLALRDLVVPFTEAPELAKRTEQEP